MRLLRGGALPAGSLVLAAHADDEVVGAALLLEMTGYHARDGGLVVGEFLPPTSEVIQIDPSDPELDLKQRMLHCHRSQAETLAPFRTGPERFRPAPSADFSRAPHPGELYS